MEAVLFHVAHTLQNIYQNLMLHFFEQSGIVPICAADSTRVLWAQSLSSAKIISEQHVSKCEQGLKPCKLFVYLICQ